MIQATFHSAITSDINEIKSLLESVFGPYPKLEELITKWITQDEYNVVVAKINSKVIGVSTWCLKLNSDFSKYESFGKRAIEFMNSHKFAHAMNLAVEPQYRKNKIGQKLSLEQFSWLEKQDCNAVVGSSWVNGSDDHSQHLFSKAGFTKLGESKDFLRQQLQNGALCSVCKTPECSCNSILFGIKTSDLFRFSELGSIK